MFKYLQEKWLKDKSMTAQGWAYWGQEMMERPLHPVLWTQT